MKRIAKILGFLALGIALFIAGTAMWEYYCWEFRYPRQMKQCLGSATDPRTAVNQLGVFLEIKEGGWIAIRYDDTHRFGFSRAVGLTSSGVWIESPKHFCAGLMGYGISKAHCRLEPDYDVHLTATAAHNELYRVLRRAELSKNIDDALAVLREVEFFVTDGPASTAR